MRHELRAIVTILKDLASARERLLRFASELRQNSQVAAVSTGLDIRTGKPLLTIEMFVDVTLQTRHSLCWWLELTPSDLEWNINARVLFNQCGHGQEVLEEYQQRTAASAAQFTEHLERAVADLTQATYWIDSH